MLTLVTTEMCRGQFGTDRLGVQQPTYLLCYRPRYHLHTMLPILLLLTMLLLRAKGYYYYCTPSQGYLYKG